MNRKRFLQVSGITAGTLVAGGTGFNLLFEHKTSHQAHAVRAVKFARLEEALMELDQLAQAQGISLSGDWSLYQNLIHCAQSIEFSIEGYPAHKPILFKRTLGKWAWQKFEAQGFMAHNINEPIPEAPAIPEEGATDQAITRLRNAILHFEAFKGALRPHFAYGALSKKAYAKAHAMHLADHFGAIVFS